MPERPESMSCTDVQQHLDAYIDGDLSAARTRAAEAHLATCPRCREEHHLAVAVRDGLRALPELDAPPEVLRSVLSEAGAERFRRPTWTYLAAAVLAAVLGLSLWTALIDRSVPGSDDVTTPVEIAAGEVDSEEVQRATAEARYALAYLASVSRKAGRKIRDDFLIERVAQPTVRGLTRPFLPIAADPEPPPAERRDRS